MKYLIIYAHPEHPGYCQAILEESKKFLEAKSINYEVLDLYKMRFDPVLKEEEHYIGHRGTVSPENQKIQEKIKASDRLIFIYPVWWGTMPAILKGFIDRVFTPNFSFKYVNGRPVGLLRGKRAVVFLTAGGPGLVYRIIGFTARKQIKRNILWFMGIKTKVCPLFSARGIDRPGQLKRVKSLVTKNLS